MAVQHGQNPDDGAAIRLKALGGIAVLDADGEPIESILGQEKRLALLAYLALATPRGRHRRDTLLGLFWPDRGQKRARAALRQVLHYLRTELGEEALVGSGTQDVGIDPSRVRSDVMDFEAALTDDRLEEALDLYGGDLLKGFYVSGVSPEFEHWLDGERERLRSKAADAAWALTARAAEASDKRAAVRWGRRALALTPYSESSLRRLLELLNELDAVAEALAVYHEFARQFHDVFEAQPSEETRAVVQRLQSRLEPGAPIPATPEVAETGFETEATEHERPASGDTDVEGAAGSEELPGRRPSERPENDADSTFDLLATAAADTTTLSRQWWWGGSVVLTLVLALIAWGVWSTTRSPVTTPNPDLVAVFPFAVHDADPEIEFLGEGLADLLATRVWGDAPLRAMSPADLSVEIAGVQGEEDLDEGPRDRRLQVAKAAGAGRMIEGRIVGGAQSMIISASVFRTGEEEPEARISLSGPLDSLSSLVDRIAASLLIGSAGEDAAALAGTPLTALNSYLLGQDAYRSGRYEQAVQFYRDALDQDSTFVHAAVGLASAARSVAGLVSDVTLETALEGRDRLSTSEQDFLDALVGSGLGQRAMASQLGAWERAVEAMPHRPDTWYWLGDLLFHQGSSMGLATGRERALGVLERAVEIDSTYMPALTHLLDLAVLMGDRKRVDTLYDQYVRLEPDRAQRAYLDWRVAELRMHRPTLDSVARSFPDLPANTLLQILGGAQLDGRGLDRATAAVEALMSQANPRRIQWATYHLLHHFFLNRGRPGEALRMTRLAGDLYPDDTRHLQMRILDALYSDGDRDAAARAAETLESLVAEAPEDPDGLDILCVLEQWKIRNGNTEGTRTAIERLEAGIVGDDVVAPTPHACAPVLTLLLDHDEGRHIAMDRLRAIGRSKPAWVASWESPHVAHLVVARIHEQQGDLVEALRMLQRRPYHYAQGTAYLSAFLRHEARLARSLGEHTTAAAALRHVQALRADD